MLIAFYGDLNISVKNKITDRDGRILILETEIDTMRYLFINLYNANTEPEQLKTLGRKVGIFRHKLKITDLIVQLDIK